MSPVAELDPGGASAGRTGRLLGEDLRPELAISLHTVNDHIKAIFDKTGVCSAGQLRAQVFAQQLTGPGR